MKNRLIISIYMLVASYIPFPFIWDGPVYLKGGNKESNEASFFKFWSFYNFEPFSVKFSL